MLTGSNIARLLRRATKGEPIATTTLAQAATQLERTEIDLDALEQVFPYEFRRAGNDLVLRQATAHFQPAARTTDILLAWTKAHLKSMHRTHLWTPRLAATFGAYLKADAEPLGSADRVAADEVIQRELEARDVTGHLRAMREAASQQHHRARS
jgi:hypothetical protein